MKKSRTDTHDRHLATGGCRISGQRSVAQGTQRAAIRTEDFCHSALKVTFSDGSRVGLKQKPVGSSA